MEKSFLPIWERCHVIGQFRHDPLGDGTLRHSLSCLAILRGDGISVEVNVTDADRFYVAATKPCRHSQKHSKAAVRFVNFHMISTPKCWEEPELLPGFEG